MPEVAEFPTDILADPALIDVLCAEAASAEQLRRLEQLRLRAKKGRTFLREQADNLSQLYEEVAQIDDNAEYLSQVTEVVLEKRRAAAERLSPGIEALRQKLAARGYMLDPAIRRLFEESVDIAVGWLALYDGLYRRLCKLACDRRNAAREVLRARPVAGDIDHEALSREFMARFPKIRAALAK